MSQYVVTIKYTPDLNRMFDKGIDRMRVNAESEEAAKYIIENSMYFSNLQDAKVIKIRHARYLKKYNK